jgi:hypothetical protein
MVAQRPASVCAAIDLDKAAPPLSVVLQPPQVTPMRLAFATLVCASTLLTAACSSGAAEPGSPEWCKNTPQDKQVEDPTAMSKCLEQAAS